MGWVKAFKQKSFYNAFSQLVKNVRKAMSKDPSPEKLEKILQGTTLNIYWFLLTHPEGIAGIREIQKTLNLSSPGLVSYHINNLISIGILAKNEQDKYYVKEEIKTGILGFYFRLGYHVVPRFTLYLIVFICCLVIFLGFLVIRGDIYILDPSNWVFLFVLIFGTMIFMYESLKIWRMKP
ncbi:MAG: hypothetical protein ACFFAU_12370 [Candidatus Hodarchaeota archaeon]